ncbi:MAG: hypothetical protein J5850_04945, partial [Clostridia bacterium]|nr:hypothetical protein [Clostridia bacterium]
MKKTYWIVAVLYYFLVPIAFLFSLFLMALPMRISSLRDNLGAIVVITYGILFILSPVIVFIIMRFSLFKWYIDPIAAAEIPISLYLAMVINNVLNHGVSLSLAFRAVNMDLTDDYGMGFIFFAFLFIVSLIASLSFNRRIG